MAETPNLGLTLLEVGQAAKEAVTNANMLILDGLGINMMLDMTGSAPTTGDLPDGWGTLRYTPGGAVILYVRNGGSILAMVLGTPG